MSFNVSKCEVLRLSLRNPLEFSYVLCTMLHRISTAWELRNLLSACKSSQMLTELLDVCSTNSRVCDLLLVPHLKQNIDKLQLESVQRSISGMI